MKNNSILKKALMALCTFLFLAGVAFFIFDQTFAKPKINAFKKELANFDKVITVGDIDYSIISFGVVVKDIQINTNHINELPFISAELDSLLENLQHTYPNAYLSINRLTVSNVKLVEKEAELKDIFYGIDQINISNIKLEDLKIELKYLDHRILKIKKLSVDNFKLSNKTIANEEAIIKELTINEFSYKNLNSPEQLNRYIKTDSKNLNGYDKENNLLSRDDIIFDSLALKDISIKSIQDISILGFKYEDNNLNHLSKIGNISGEVIFKDLYQSNGSLGSCISFKNFILKDVEILESSKVLLNSKDILLNIDIYKDKFLLSSESSSLNLNTNNLDLPSPLGLGVLGSKQMLAQIIPLRPMNLSCRINLNSSFNKLYKLTQHNVSFYIKEENNAKIEGIGKASSLQTKNSFIDMLDGSVIDTLFGSLVYINFVNIKIIEDKKGLDMLTKPSPSSTLLKNNLLDLKSSALMVMKAFGNEDLQNVVKNISISLFNNYTVEVDIKDVELFL